MKTTKHIGHSAESSDVAELHSELELRIATDAFISGTKVMVEVMAGHKFKPVKITAMEKIVAGAKKSLEG